MTRTFWKVSFLVVSVMETRTKYFKTKEEALNFLDACVILPKGPRHFWVRRPETIAKYEKLISEQKC